MYRIELAPGEEALFKSIDEMAAGIANGVIKSNARIWHQTSAKWLPIEFHPHYKIALTKGPHTSPRAEYREPPSVAGPAAMPTPPIFEQAAPRPIFEAPTPAAAPASIFDRPAPAPAPLFERPVPSPYSGEAEVPAVSLATLAGADVGGRGSGCRLYRDPPAPRPRADLDRRCRCGGGDRGSWRRSGHLGLPLVTHAVRAPDAHGYRPDDAGQLRRAAGSDADATPSFGSRTSRPAEDSVNTSKSSPDAGRIADAPRIVDAPKLSLNGLSLSDSDRPASDRPSSSITPAMLVAHYAAAYEAARSELDRGVRLAGLSSIFAAARLAPGQVAGARSTIAGVGNLVRVYRKRSATIEQSYRDSVNLLTRQIGWTPSQIAVWENRPTQLEAPEVGAMANALLDTMDEVLGVLSAQEGGYRLSGSTVSFDDAAAAREYTAARRRLAGLVGSGADSGTPAGRLIRALGRSTPPEEKAGS